MIKSMEKAFSLEGRHAIVTGANKGIGKGIAEALAQEGASVAILARDAAAAQAVVAEFKEKRYPGKFAFYPTDISSTANCKESVAAVIRDYGWIDILVNNSGIGVHGGLLDMPEDLSVWDNCLNVDLNGAFRMCYFVGRHMRERGKGGKIVNITSNAGAMVNKPVLLSAYSVAKAGLNMLTKNLAVELGGYGINVNAIAPGYTYSTLTNNLNDEDIKIHTEKMPVGRFGHPIEIGALAVYLVSDASEMMTGMVCTIDGGYSLAI
ncbi:MAG: SDR family oxidoreductase [Oscillospiraceae bacterium]|jgi:NAD(P)-dependent dehydrogenase (short-subunit alcohol dehydrogenase family)|nr:SDR family oxidoreductase [Oscillospiraceae bacterium]